MKEKIFDTTNYNSNSGMLTFIWGPALWHSLHTMSFNYPIKPTTEEKNQYLNFFNSLAHVLPCKYCRDNYVENLKTMPLNSKVLKNRDNFSLWLYNLHELINTNLGKKSGLTFNEIRDRYEHFRSRCLIDPKNFKKNGKSTELGCTESLYGIKSKCILNIVPKDSQTSTFKISSKCKIVKK